MRPRHGPWVTSISTAWRSVVSSVGIDHGGDGEGIVHWGVVMPIDLEVEPPIERVQVGDDGAGAARSRAARRRVAALSIARWVTSRPTIVTFRPEWKTRWAASGSPQTLNSARRRDVAVADRAAHQDDPLDPVVQLGVEREQQRDVGERADRDQRVRALAQRARRSARRRGSARGSRDGGGRSGPSSPVSPWTSLGDPGGVDQRAVGARRDRDVRARPRRRARGSRWPSPSPASGCRPPW